MKTARRFVLLLVAIVLFLLGAVLGAYLFSDTQRRPLLEALTCSTSCLDKSELLGLVGSVIVQKNPKVLPDVLFETDKTVAINYPLDHVGEHYVVIPKKDIKNIGDVHEGDEAYVLDALAVIGKLAKDHNITSYRVVTYGPERQDVAYLHFHLIASGAN